MPGTVRFTGSGFSQVSSGSGELRAVVLGLDALRVVLDRRILRLHPHQRSSSFESLQIIIAFLKQKRVLLAPPGHYVSHNRLLSFESAQFLLALSE